MVLNSVKRLPGQRLKGKKKCHSEIAFLYSDIATYSVLKMTLYFTVLYVRISVNCSAFTESVKTAEVASAR